MPTKSDEETGAEEEQLPGGSWVPVPDETQPDPNNPAPIE